MGRQRRGPEMSDTIERETCCYCARISDYEGPLFSLPAYQPSDRCPSCGYPFEGLTPPDLPPGEASLCISVDIGKSGGGAAVLAARLPDGRFVILDAAVVPEKLADLERERGG